jgi:hypothetical protein
VQHPQPPFDIYEIKDENSVSYINGRTQPECIPQQDAEEYSYAQEAGSNRITEKNA